MGLIKAAMGAIGGNLADQWKDYFYCDSLAPDVLVTKGGHKVSGRSSNTKNEDVITDGAGISINEGQCMMIVESGKVIDLCAEPGVYTYDSGTSPSVFVGPLWDGIKKTVKDMWERFTFGGGVGKDQRVYYFNIKEIIGNKYGTATPIPFRVYIDKSLGKALDVSLRCNGEYSYKIVNPMVFYQNVCGNISEDYTRDAIDSQLKSELLGGMQEALAKISAQGVGYSEIPGYADEIADALNEVLTQKWIETRGLQIESFSVKSVSVPDEDMKRIQDLQTAVMMMDPMLAAGNLANAQADAMRMAASNPNGSMNGFMGMGMANMTGGTNAGNLFAMGQAMQQQMPAGGMAGAPQPAGGWTCSCGTANTGKFCSECGSPRPEA